MTFIPIFQSKKWRPGRWGHCLGYPAEPLGLEARHAGSPLGDVRGWGLTLDSGVVEGGRAGWGDVHRGVVGFPGSLS